MAYHRRRLNMFNMIIVHEPGRYEYREALSLIEKALRGYRYRVFDTPPPLILVKVENPFEASKKIMSLISLDSPILRIIPLDAVTYAFIEDVKTVTLDVAKSKLYERESYAIKVEGAIYGRDEKGALYRLHKIDVIKPIAAQLANPVNLDSPDKLILIKSIRVSRSLRYAGIMVSAPSDIYSKYGKRYK